MTVQPLTVSQEAFKILIADLEVHGSSPGGAHRAALLELVSVMTDYAYDTEHGRKAFGLPTGAGKTSAIVAWITAVYRLGIDDVAVSIAASQVEALCSIKRSLIGHGVPESQIGLKHSLSGASEPSTGNADRRFQLVTHARVRSGADLDLLLRHRGSKRKLMIYDETLFRSDTGSTRVHDLSVNLAAFRQHVRTLGQDYGPLMAYLERCEQIVTEGVEALKLCEGSQVKIVHLPQLHPIESAGFLAQLEQLVVPKVDTTPLVHLLAASQKPLRLITTAQGVGLIWHEVAVPNEVRNVIVLDASYQIRTLAQLDMTVSEGWSFCDFDVKRYDRVTIHQLHAPGGRTSITKSFSERDRQHRMISREVAEIVKTHSEATGVLLFTYKRREIDIGKRLLDDLGAAGIDTEEELPDGSKRINLLAWGSETSLNDFAHCDLVIMVGVMQRSHLDMAATIIGQQDDIAAPIDNPTIKGMVESEVAHLIYQGASRGSCRIIENGQARPMDLYFIHRDIGIQGELKQVMKGATWRVWEPRYTTAVSTSAMDVLALQIHHYLSELPETVERVSSKKIKEDLRLTLTGESGKRAFSRAIRVVSELSNEWELVGRSMERSTSTFLPEPVYGTSS